MKTRTWASVVCRSAVQPASNAKLEMIVIIVIRQLRAWAVRGEEARRESLSSCASAAPALAARPRRSSSSRGASPTHTTASVRGAPPGSSGGPTCYSCNKVGGGSRRGAGVLRAAGREDLAAALEAVLREFAADRT